MAVAIPSILLALAVATQAVQPSAPSPQPATLRDLQWSQLNFLHTTDTHGWHAGHLQEASYSADWGDYISFAHHMHKIADDKGVDLLLIDTGDRIEGNGLYDASEPKGKHTFDIFKHQQIDILCSGNHELYKKNSSENELSKTVPNFKGNYLASNIDIADPKTGKFKPLAKRWKKITTKNQGIRITSFGFLYNFQGNYNNTRVQPVQDTVKEKWFQDAIRDKDTDLILVIGHVAVRSEEYDTIFQAIRQVQWDTPIQFFGGHTHIRDYKKYDDKSVAIESGRYMETIGFMSIDKLSTGKNKSVDATASRPVFARRYIDNNLFSFYHHSHTNSSNFSTELGTNVTKQITAARTQLGLDKVSGCAPQDYWVSRAPVNDSSSIFPLLGNQIIPDQLRDSNSTTPKLVFSNTGAVRFDVFKGPFTKDSEFLVSPFTSGFRQLKDVDYAAAKRLIEVLNHGAPMLKSIDPSLDPRLLPPPEQVTMSTNIITSQIQDPAADTMRAAQAWVETGQVALLDEPAPLPGYTTHDDDGDDGDDTLHTPVKYYGVPNCIESRIGFDDKTDAADPDKVDVVYNEFIEPWVLAGLKFLGADLSPRNTSSYLGGVTLTEVLAEWVAAHWPCEDEAGRD